MNGRFYILLRVDGAENMYVQTYVCTFLVVNMCGS